MGNIVVKKKLPEFESTRFRASEFEKFSSDAYIDAIDAGNIFSTWEQELSDLSIKLDKDPTLNLFNFYPKLEEVQARKERVIQILSEALSIKAMWESNLSVAYRFVLQIRGHLSSLPEVNGKKNKELQEALMYEKFPEVFDFYSFCEATLDWIKTMITVFDKKLELVESANTNLARQINVTELLSMKGLI